VRLENGMVELALQVLVPGKTIEAIRIDNLGGVSSCWRTSTASPINTDNANISGFNASAGVFMALGQGAILFDRTTLVSYFY